MQSVLLYGSGVGYSQYSLGGGGNRSVMTRVALSSTDVGGYGLFGLLSTSGNPRPSHGSTL